MEKISPEFNYPSLSLFPSYNSKHCSLVLDVVQLESWYLFNDVSYSQAGGPNRMTTTNPPYLTSRVK